MKVELSGIMRLVAIIVASLLAGASICAKAQTDDSAPSELAVTVSAPFEPVDAVGIVLSSSGAEERPVLEFKYLGSGSSVVRFPLKSGDAAQGTFASAMIVSTRGEVAFGDITPVRGQGTHSVFSLPECPEEKIPSSLTKEKFGVYEPLVEYRTSRRDLAKVEITRLMDEDTLIRLRKLEDGFGLSRGMPLIPEMPPVELVDRLERLLWAVKTYTASRRSRAVPGQVDAAQPPAQ